MTVLLRPKMWEITLRWVFVLDLVVVVVMVVVVQGFVNSQVGSGFGSSWGDILVVSFGGWSLERIVEGMMMMIVR